MTSLLAQAGGFNVLQSVQDGFSTLMNYLPQFIGALLVLIIGYFIAKLLQKALTKLLNKFRLDDRLTAGQGGQYVERFSPQGSPARLVGLVVFWVLMLFVISSAIGTLGIPALTAFMNQVLSYLPNVIAALLIFLIAAAIAGGVGGFAHRAMGDTPTGRVVRTVAPSLVMVIAVFMILTQLNIAPIIVSATFIALIGSLALGSALAFGLGGREAAADLINSGYRRARQEQDTVKHDMQLGRERAERDTERAREYARQSAGDDRSGDGQGGEHGGPSSGGSYRVS